MKFWPYLVGAWFVVHGLSSLINLQFRYDDELMAILSVVAGVFVFFRK